MTTQTELCPPIVAMRSFLEGNLPDEQFEQIAAHLLTCERCVAACQEWDGLRSPVFDAEQSSQGVWEEFKAALVLTGDQQDAINQRTLAMVGHTPSQAASKGSDAAEYLPIGAVVGSYTVLERIGAGGMGCVVRARHEKLGRIVAMKVPFLRLTSSPEGEQRFLREARAASKLQHPNICPVHEVGEWQGRPFLVMAYIAGMTLAAWRRQQQPSAHEAARIVAAMSRGVAHAHQQGIIHRDIKPSNVIIEAEADRPILTDFGLARDVFELDETLTATGQLMGTPAYMAPEQAAGVSSQIGPAADIYALGAVLYELLTERPPFQGALGEVIRAVQVDDPLPPRQIVPAIHRDLETICLRAMKRAPAERYPTAAALADDLERFCSGEAIWARPDRWWEKAIRFTRRRQKAIFATAALLVVCLALVGYFATSASHTREVSSVARQLQAALQTTDWNEEQLATAAALSRRLRELDPEHQSAAPGLVEAALVEFINRNMLSKSRLEQADVARASELIALLKRQDEAAAERLATRLTGRLREWQIVTNANSFTTEQPPAFLIEGSEYSDLLVDQQMLRRPPATSPLPAGVADYCYFARDPLKGNVRLEVTFRDAWLPTDQVALVLATENRHRYVFRLSPVAPRAKDKRGEPIVEPTPFSSSAWLAIERDGVLLRRVQQNIGKQIGSEGKLTLTATYEDRRLSLHVRHDAGVEFTDLFFLPQLEDGFQLGVQLPPGAAITSYSASKQTLPPQPSGLERGDQLFAQRKWQDALVEYRRQQHASSVAAEEKDELVLKEALCLDALGQRDEAAALLNPLRRSSQSLIRSAALTRLWFIYLRGDRTAEANVLFAAFKPQDMEALTQLVPEAERDTIATKVFQTGAGLEMLSVSPEALEGLRRAHLLRAAAWGGAHREGIRVLQLARGYHAAREYADGIRLLREYLERPRPDFHIAYVDLIEEYAWMLRTTGDWERAKSDIEFHLKNTEVEDGEIKRLMLERARQFAAQEKWEDCLAEIDSYLKSRVAENRYFFYSTAHLMRGFCLRRLGRAEEAQQAWREALCERWRVVTKLRDADLYLTGMPLENALLAVMLTKQCTSAELTQLIKASDFSRQQPLLLFVTSQFSDKLLPVLLRVGDDPQAMVEMERLVFQQRPLADHLRAPIHLIGNELFRHAAQNAAWQSGDRQATHQFWDEAIDGFCQKRLEFGQIAQGLAAWSGKTGELGWTGLAPELPPNLRGPLALMIAMKRTNAGESPEVEELLHAADQDLAADSPLRLHLKRLQKPAETESSN